MLRMAVPLITAVALLAGCASPPLGGGLFGSGLSPPLEAQRTRLKQALQGTPVVVEATGDRRLRVEVPTRHAFEPGRATVKPALAAVLEQVATGFKPYAATTELQIGAPHDDKATTKLVRERAASTRDHLVSRGVPASRIARAGATTAPGLELLLSDRPMDRR